MDILETMKAAGATLKQQTSFEDDGGETAASDSELVIRVSGEVKETTDANSWLL